MGVNVPHRHLMDISGTDPGVSLLIPTLGVPSALYGLSGIKAGFIHTRH